MSSTSKAGIHITPRSPHLDFSALRPCWFDGDCAISAAWNALGMVAAAGEGTFITAGRSLLEHVTDESIADDTRRFIQQETQHARLHTQFSTKLQEQGVPIAISRDPRPALEHRTCSHAAMRSKRSAAKQFSTKA